jgi:hypothetical protein
MATVTVLTTIRDVQERQQRLKTTQHRSVGEPKVPIPRDYKVSLHGDIFRRFLQTS